MNEIDDGWLLWLQPNDMLIASHVERDWDWPSQSLELVQNGRGVRPDDDDGHLRVDGAGGLRGPAFVASWQLSGPGTEVPQHRTKHCVTMLTVRKLQY